jgi:hypothetical protein
MDSSVLNSSAVMSTAAIVVGWGIEQGEYMLVVFVLVEINVVIQDDVSSLGLGKVWRSSGIEDIESTKERLISSRLKLDVHGGADRQGPIASFKELGPSALSPIKTDTSPAAPQVEDRVKLSYGLAGHQRSFPCFWFE